MRKGIDELEMYSKLSLSDCQDVYDNKIKDFPF